MARMTRRARTERAAWFFIFISSTSGNNTEQLDEKFFFQVMFSSSEDVRDAKPVTGPTFFLLDLGDKG